MPKRFVIFLLILFVFLGRIFATGTLVPSVDNDSTYVKTKLVNGSFDTKPSMTNGVVNGVGQGWNTTESIGFEWQTKTYIHDSETLTANNWVEMNYDNACSYWQDLYTNGGDVIKWSLKHAARTGYATPQSINVNIGNPVRDNNNKLVAATGNGNIVSNNIQETGLAVYTGSGITAGSETVAFANTEEIKGLAADDYTKWFYAKGIYIVPSDQTITRFAFQSMIEGGAGNILDDVDVVTLIGNLTAALQRDGSLKLYGFWGETDTSKKMVVTLGTKSWQVDMSTVCDKNFVITIPKADVPENATSIKVYHEDYRCAERTIDFIPGYNVLMYVGNKNKSDGMYDLGPSIKAIKTLYEATTSTNTGKVKISALYTYDQDCLVSGTDLINKYSLIFVCFPDEFNTDTQTVANNLINYAEQGGCLVMVGEHVGGGRENWYPGDAVLSILAEKMGIDVAYGKNVPVNNGKEITVNPETSLTNVEGSMVKTLLSGAIPKLIIGQGSNTKNNTTIVGTIYDTNTAKDEPVITDTKVNNGYITFLTDINMWMGWTGINSSWVTTPSWPGDSKNFMKNLLTRSINNIEAVSNMNKITYVGLEGSHYASDGGENTLTNPSKYSSADTFTLNNPIKEGWIFTGWSGTGLVGNFNMTVTVPTGSTGDRYYTAHFSKHAHQWVYGLTNDGKSLTAHCDGSDEYAYLCEYHDASNSLVLEIIPEYKKQLTATVDAGALVKTVTWSSADESIATVDKNGLVTGLKPGQSTTIYATSNDGSNITAECTVTIPGKSN